MKKIREKINVKTYDELIVGQPLDGINNLGATWAGTNVAVGAAEDKSLPLDLLEVELANDAGQKHISFLGVTIGLIADCDIGKSAVHVLLSRFYPDSIQILSWFYPHFILILYDFIQILS